MSNPDRVLRFVFACDRTMRRYRLSTPCLNCGDHFIADAAVVAAVVGDEVIGYLGACCLGADVQARLQREAQAVLNTAGDK